MRRAVILGLAVLGCSGCDAADLPQWPPIGSLQRPWTIHWWFGSAVEAEPMARELERYRDAGLGGIHIVPIYGPRAGDGRERIAFTPDWYAAVDATMTVAGRLGLGVDVTLGTGWCFGGPAIAPQLGVQDLTTLVTQDPHAKALQQPSAGRQWIHLQARGPQGQTEDLRTHLDAQGRLRWASPGPGWTITGLSTRPTGLKVKRAAPGGAGLMLNPFDPAAMEAHLASFGTAWQDPGRERPRAFFHDSFEYFSAAWAPDLPAEFLRRRGYDLDSQAAALAGAGDPDLVGRVWHDYRLTASDLLVEGGFTAWAAWCHRQGSQARLQAHGAPGNLLDLYALADLPETEMFGHAGDPLDSRLDERIGEADRDIVCSKFASSAAHVMGRPRCSAETGTWVAEHFHESLAELKGLCDRLFVAGVNHVLWHGSAYAPDDRPWPGWLFYAAAQLNPRNPLWREFPVLNTYVARCQALLQQGRTDHDLLLYWPLEDRWQDPKPGLEGLTVHRSRQWIPSQARTLWQRGWQYDLISDRQIAALRQDRGQVVTAGGTSYRTVLVPSARTMPVATLARLVALAEAGATICLEAPLPTDVPGLERLAERRQDLAALLARFTPGIPRIPMGAGQILIGPAETILAEAGARREPLMDEAGLLVERRRMDHATSYLIVHQGARPWCGWAPLGVAATAVAALDPLTGTIGTVPVRAGPAGGSSVWLDLQPGQSLFLHGTTTSWEGQPFRPPHAGAEVLALPGPWTVTAVAGGPALPTPWTTPTARPWTDRDDPASRAFSGTAVYRTACPRPTAAGPLVLTMGEVQQVARVRINGQDLGAVIMPPWQVTVPASVWREGEQTIEIEVTNLGANRLRDLARRGETWLRTQDPGLVDITYRPLNPGAWPVAVSGLAGPVALHALEVRDPGAEAQP